MHRLSLCAAVAVALLAVVHSGAHAQELEAQVFAGIPADQATLGVNAGIGLTERLTLLSGIRAGLLDMGIEETEDRASYQMFFIAVPLELKIYAMAPVAGAVIPTVRLGAAYQIARDRPKEGSLFENAPTRVHTLNGSALVGAQYLIDEHVGLSMEAGLAIRRDFIDTSDGSMPDGLRIVGLTWRAGLVLRL